jgi:hypothetical protein
MPGAPEEVEEGVRSAGRAQRGRLESGSGGDAAMSSPEYLVCLECETPCYEFEWEDGKISEVLCVSCGSDDPEQFALPEDVEG